MNLIVFMIVNRYQCIEIIGKGEFGSLYKAVHTRSNECVALKREPYDSPGKLLKNEAKIYQYLSRCPGFPRVKWFGVYDNSVWLAMDLLGLSLKQTKIMETNKQKEISMIGVQMLERLETLHSKGLLHRDIKPDNFLWPREDSYAHATESYSQTTRCSVFRKGSASERKQKDLFLYLIDFGFTKSYLQEDGVTHIPYRDQRTPLGTPAYISLNVHGGAEPSRRDDIESVVYIMIYLLFEREKEIVDLVLWKQGLLTNIEIPNEWREMLLYVRQLVFAETPDYSYLKDLLKKCMKQ
jgi:serine/threonine protein kinase